MDYFTKFEDDHDFLDLEYAGLKWLSPAMESGGAVVCQPVGISPGKMKLIKISETGTNAVAAHEFGRALALTHAQGAPGFGCAPSGYSGRLVLGRFFQKLQPANSDEKIKFSPWFATERLACFLPKISENYSEIGEKIKIIEKVIKRVNDNEFGDKQPSLIKTVAARIHGDLWNGNLLWAKRETLEWICPQAGLGPSMSSLNPSQITGVLIDPMSQGGHGESDLAQLGVFGQSFLTNIYQGYNEVSALSPGWQERRFIFELHMFLLHAALFGGSYLNQAFAIAKKFA